MHRSVANKLNQILLYILLHKDHVCVLFWLVFFATQHNRPCPTIAAFCRTSAEGGNRRTRVVVLSGKKHQPKQYTNMIIV